MAAQPSLTTSAQQTRCGKMKQAIVHIGAEKTGSTSIQFSLSKNRELLKEEGILYPRSLGDKNHIAAYAYASERGMDELKQQWQLTDKDRVDAFRVRIKQELISECNASGVGVICVSNEHCSSRLQSSSEIQRLLDLLRSVADDVKVVYYIREQVETVVSAYSQYVKTGGTKAFLYPDEAYIGERLDYRSIIQRWIDVIGKDNMAIRIFSGDRLTAGDVISDFVAYLGLDPQPFVLPERRNKQLGSVGLETLRRMNAFLPGAVAGEINPLRGNSRCDFRGHAGRLGIFGTC